MTTQQLIVDLENEPGRLFTVAGAVAAAGINVYATTLTDNGRTGSARLLVSDVRRARAVVMELDVPARMEEVLVVVLPDVPGGLAELLEPLFDDYVNILQFSAFAQRDGAAIAVMRFSDNRFAEGILREHGYETVDPAKLFHTPEESQ